MGLFSQISQSVYNFVIGRTYDNTVIVKQASDLANIDSSKNYMIDGAIDMGSTPIVVPSGGLSLAGLNGARDTSQLYSTAENYTMFVSPVGSYSGDLLLESCTIEVSGANSKAFDLDNDENANAVDIQGVNFVNCTELGEFTDYRQFALQAGS